MKAKRITKYTLLYFVWMMTSCSSEKFSGSNESKKPSSDKSENAAGYGNGNNGQPLNSTGSGDGSSSGTDGNLSTSSGISQGAKWYQADNRECSAFCIEKELKNIGDPLSGAKCAAGEIRPANAVNSGIKFTNGCWPDCSPVPDAYYKNLGGTSSVKNECYHPGENQDHDSTDRTVACFCG